MKQNGGIASKSNQTEAKEWVEMHGSDMGVELNGIRNKRNVPQVERR